MGEALQLINPYQIFLGLDGLALDEGYVYAGTPNADPETSPVALFWDEAGTIPAAQPLRTSAGVIVRDGTPARVYGPASYSIRVRNKQGVQVFYNAAVSTSADDVAFRNVGAPAIRRSVQQKLREDGCAITDYGAVPGSGDDTAAIDYAIDEAVAAGHKTVLIPGGDFSYTGQLLKPAGVRLIGIAGRDNSRLTIDSDDGYGIIVKGSYGEVAGLSIQYSGEGIKLETEQASVAYTLSNYIHSNRLIGPGRAPTFAGRSTHGILFDRMGGPGVASATFFNYAYRNIITQFDDLVTYDAAPGGAAAGGNANWVFENEMQSYWVAHNIFAIENWIAGDFFHAASGLSNAEPTIAYWLNGNAHYNYIDPGVGEPGNFTQCFRVEDATYANRIMGEGLNFPIQSRFGGSNNVIGWTGGTVGSLTENRYYRVKFTRALTNYCAGSYRLRWSSNAAALGSVSAGYAEINVRKAAGAPVFSSAGKVQSSTGAGAINLVGIFLNPNNELEAVFYAGNNGTGTSAGNLVFDVVGAGIGATVVQNNVFNDAGTVDPSTWAVP